jgi:hypothetical protein
MIWSYIILTGFIRMAQRMQCNLHRHGADNGLTKKGFNMFALFLVYTSCAVSIWAVVILLTY